MFYDSIEKTIGNTPLVRLGRLEKYYGLTSRIYAKLEYFNPGGSVKDRTALNMLDEAFKRGDIDEGWTIVEPTSGNTGIGLALAACKYNLRVILVMPESVTKERIALMKALGAETVMTPAESGIKGAIEKANAIIDHTKKSYMPMQFENPDNPGVHYKSTAVEIVEDLGRYPDVFIAGVGTGGTLTGCGKYFNESAQMTRIIAVEPFESSVISGNEPGKHGIQGIGAGFVPTVLDMSLIDGIVRVKTEQAIEYERSLTCIEKITGGISAGAALYAAVLEARNIEDGDVVFIVPDTMERYLSTGLFD